MIRSKQRANHLKKQKKHSSTTGHTSELTLLEHVYELRTRLFWVVAVFILASALGFQFKDQLISVIMEPLHGQKLIYLTPAGGFSFIFTLSLYFGALLTIPFTVYHIYRFVQPVLGAVSRRATTLYMVLSALLAAIGAVFGYFVTIPAAITFLSTFAGDVVVPSLTAESYLSFVVTYILGLAALFQLPLLINIFDRARPIPPGTLMKSQQYVIVGAAVVAAIITPTPDAFNMAIVAIPIVAMYQMGVVAVLIRHGARSSKARKLAKAEARERIRVVSRPVAVPVVAPAQTIEDKEPTQTARVVQAVAEIQTAPITQPPPTASATPLNRASNARSMDGFTRRPVIGEMKRPVTTTTQQRPRRSIDGFIAAPAA